MTIPFASQFTQTLPPLLNQLGVSLLISTYQAGQLIILRSRGEGLNTHFCAMEKPMGLAASADKLSVGSAFQVWEYRNMPAVAKKVEPQNTHDACYLPRQVHVTGDIDIHEMAYADDTLWLVNTRMSCLCTLNRAYSIEPRWRPPFVTAYDLTDRCHLNGLAMREGKPAFLTALGETDSAGGWRQNKAGGGLLMEYPSGHILTRGLSMPHSPRWYRNKLWFLESGKGSLSTLDPGTGKTHIVVEMPGFTRGLDFVGRFAFIGLSQVRETAVFAGLPLTERVSERHCGMWVVDIERGQIVAYVIFTGDVREIFAVQALPARFPAILELSDNLLRSSYALPNEALADVAPPDPMQVLMEKATRAHSQKKHQEAVKHYRDLLAQHPDHIQARYQLGAALVDLESWHDAIAELNDATRRQSHHAEAQNSLGMAYSGLGQWEQALAHFQKAIDADKSYATAHFNRGLILLKLGRFEQGWEGYDWRWQMPTFTPLRCPQPQWRDADEDISDKTLLVHTEQGNGNAIQFARLLPVVAKRCKKLIVACSEPLRPILSTVEGVAEVRLPGVLPQDSFDIYAPIMSLPRILGITLETIPSITPYLNIPDNIAVPRLSGTGKLKIGIVWAGSSTHKNDLHRSCALQELTPLFNFPEADFFSFQMPLSADDRVLLNQHNVISVDAELTDYARTAALVAQLDLVIGVDTSLIHVAGALAKPVWVLLSVHSDWRWLLDRDDNPWYPSARLFRQSKTDDWRTLISRVRSVLEDLAA